MTALKSLRVRSLRNLADADVAVPPRGCVVVGPNGHGKTNLIEALLYCEVFRSFRGAQDAAMVRFGADGFHVEAVIGNGSGRGTTVAAGYDARTKQKKVTLDGSEPARLADAIGAVRGVVLSPLDVALVAGEPRGRRRYLDVLLALTARGYLEALTKYRKALALRTRATPAEMPAFEAVLAEAGQLLWTARRAWADRWSGPYAAHCAAMGEAGTSRMSYAPRTDGGEQALLEALSRTREKDRALGRTSVGPHRDELRLTLEDRPLRHYGSAGQQRTGAIALRLIEAEAMAETGAPTLLCLDDAFAELDQERSGNLGELIEAKASADWQIVAAVPKEGDVPEVIASLPRWSIREGRIG
ncbi:MAG: DNA replication/repair protein RecF [Gemmatimonadales bacterium]